MRRCASTCSGRITPECAGMRGGADDQEALRRFGAEFRPVVLTDSAELIRKLRRGPPHGRRSSLRGRVDDAEERERESSPGPTNASGVGSATSSWRRIRGGAAHY